MKKINLLISGMHCPSCAELIKDALIEEGIKEAKIDSKTGNAQIVFDDFKFSEEEIKEIINEQGYKTR